MDDVGPVKSQLWGQGVSPCPDHRGDFVLDLVKMNDWFSGELPALRMGCFTFDWSESRVDCAIHTSSEKLSGLRLLGLDAWYRTRLHDSAFADVFAEEKGWETRWSFIRAFYAFCMLPLAPKPQAFARYVLALDAMGDFLERSGGIV